MRPYSYDDKTSFLKVCKLSTAHRKNVGTRQMEARSNFEVPPGLSSNAPEAIVPEIL